MIADAVYLAIAGIGFCHAAGRSIFSSRLKVGMTTLLPQAWTEGGAGSSDTVPPRSRILEKRSILPFSPHIGRYVSRNACAAIAQTW